MKPQVTVLLPVHNGEKFLREAIESILKQTFSAFEFLIIDDRSEDNSAKIIKSFKDPRIKIVQNENNMGLARSLNKGIILAKGEYIARMDADDISFPDRLKKQLDYIRKNKYDVVAVKICLIDEKGKNFGIWPDDQKAVTGSQIESQLPKANCIAHPGVMFNKKVISKYLYNEGQKYYTEDYDLWLNLCSDGYKIGKLDEILLKYRVHENSSSVNTLYYTKGLYTRVVYVISRIKRTRLNFFDIKVLFYSIPEFFDLVVFGTVYRLRKNILQRRY